MACYRSIRWLRMFALFALCLAVSACADDGAGTPATAGPTATATRDTSVPRLKPSLTLRNHTSSVWSVSWSPDGRQLASSSADNTLRLWNVSNEVGEQQSVVGSELNLLCVAWSPDGDRLAVGCGGGAVQVWQVSDLMGNAANKQPTQSLSNAGCPACSLYSVAWSPDGDWLAAGGDDDTLAVWRVSDSAGDALRLVLKHGSGGSVHSVAWSPDGAHLASGGDDGLVSVWRLSGLGGGVVTGEQVLQLAGHSAPVTAVSWSPDGGRLASAGRDNSVRLWQLPNAPGDELALLHVLPGHTDWVEDVAWSPDGTQIASASKDKSVRVWGASGGELCYILTGNRDWVWVAAWSPDGMRLASGSADSTVRVWQLER